MHAIHIKPFFSAKVPLFLYLIFFLAPTVECALPGTHDAVASSNCDIQLGGSLDRTLGGTTVYLAISTPHI